MSTFTHRIVAGNGETEHFDQQLAELAQLVGIPPPIFRGQLLYQEYGIERWLIETTIPARIDDPTTREEIYEERYPDWDMSVQVAMQGAMARICGLYRCYIPSGSPYRTFGRRRMDGTPYFFPNNENMTVHRQHLVERECNAVDLEELMRGQMTYLDQAINTLEEANTKIEHCEIANAYVLNKRNELLEANKVLEESNKKLLERIEKLEEPRKLEEELLGVKVFDDVLVKTMKLMIEHRELLAQENAELKKKLVEAQAPKIDQVMADAEEEDPEERAIETSDGQTIWIVPEDEDKPAFNTRSHARKVICLKAIREFPQ